MRFWEEKIKVYEKIFSNKYSVIYIIIIDKKKREKYQTKYTNNKSSVCHVINRWQIKRPSIFLFNIFVQYCKVLFYPSQYNLNINPFLNLKTSINHDRMDWTSASKDLFVKGIFFIINSLPNQVSYSATFNLITSFIIIFLIWNAIPIILMIKISIYDRRDCI